MKKLLAVLAALSLLFFSFPASAGSGGAEVEFNGKTYHYTYQGAGITDGGLSVRVHGNEGVPFIGGGPKIPVMAVAEISGERFMPNQVHVSINANQTDLTFSFGTDKLPDAVWLYPDGKEAGAKLIWRTGDPEPSGSAPENSSAGVSAPEKDASAELTGEWHGEGTPSDGGAPVRLVAVIDADDTGYFHLIQSGGKDSFDFTLSREDSRITGNIPEGLALSVSAFEGTWSLEDGKLLLDVTVSFSDGRGYSLSAGCEKVAAPEYETVVFGSYDQDGSADNGAEPIEWLVLESDGTASTLISKDALDCVPFNAGGASNTWAGCTLRAWLNGEFLENAFTPEERSRLDFAEVTADPNPDYPTDPGASTRDRVFIPSFGEVMRFFPTDQSRSAHVTQTAADRGAFYSRISRGCIWWLRTPGDSESMVLTVLSAGWVETEGGVPDHAQVAVRPMIRLLDSPHPAAEPADEPAAEADFPEELVGKWTGTGTPKNGGTQIGLTILINADGSGEYSFDQGGYHESYPFTVSNDDSTFSVDIPATSMLGSVGGTWALEKGRLLLDITSVFASGGSYSYTAECVKAE